MLIEIKFIIYKRKMFQFSIDIKYLVGCVALRYIGFSEKSKLSNVELG